jgi:uncharacterized protein YndB with AHSA1/START domain
MKDNVELDATYPHPPSRVWQALTDPAALAQWLLPSDFKPLIGFRFRLDRPDGDAIQGKVLEVEEGKLLAYTWDDGESPEPSVVCWSLDPVEGGTRVRLEHRYVETPAVTCIPMDAHFNWSYAMRHSLPGLLALLAGNGGVLPRPPVLYCFAKTSDGFHAEPLSTAESQRTDRIGFRQEVMA